MWKWETFACSAVRPCHCWFPPVIPRPFQKAELGANTGVFEGLRAPLGSLLQVQQCCEPRSLQASEHVDELCQVSQAGAACLGPQQPFNPERRHGH